MKHFFYLLFLIQFQNCKSETILKPKIPSIKNAIFDKSTDDNYSIDSIERISIGKQIEESNKIKLLKSTLKKSFERQIDKPYMWDIFISSNESLLQFYDYKIFMINGTNFKSYYIKINYEDGNYESILLVNEFLDNEYNSMIVYEKLVSEENHSRITQITGDRVQIMFKSPGQSKNLDFQMKDGMFLDYFDSAIVDKKWGDKKILMGNVLFEYELKGNTNNHLKNGDWIEAKYSFEYNQIIIENGNYINGLRDGDWYYSPEGPVDQIKKFDKGKFISKPHR